MGEIAEMMMDGTLCCNCGVYLDELELENVGIIKEDDFDIGFPISCASCLEKLFSLEQAKKWFSKKKDENEMVLCVGKKGRRRIIFYLKEAEEFFKDK